MNVTELVTLLRGAERGDHGCTDSDCPCDGRSLIYQDVQR